MSAFTMDCIVWWGTVRLHTRFGEAAIPELQTPGVGVDKIWTPARQVELYAPSFRPRQAGLQAKL